MTDATVDVSIDRIVSVTVNGVTQEFTLAEFLLKLGISTKLPPHHDGDVGGRTIEHE